MQPQHSYRHSRINLAELKAQMIKKLGLEASQQYFHCLNRFLSWKLTKVEFSKLCFRIIGRENIRLHNQLTRSILRNACSAKFPPPVHHKDDVLKRGGQISCSDVSANGYQPNGLLNRSDVLPQPLPLSPRKARTGLRRTGTGAHRMALGAQMPVATQSTDFDTPLENGNVHPSGTGRPGQRVENENKMTVAYSVGMRSRDGSVPSCSKHSEAELLFRDDVKEDSARSPLQAPLGVRFCPFSTGIVQSDMPLASSNRFTCTVDNVLPDNLTLRDQMDQISVLQGLGGGSLDSAIVLNLGLDSYMKGLMRSCIELMGARSGHELSKNHTEKHHSCTTETHPQITQSLITFQDLRVAMDLHPQKLGADWPLLLEKICTQSFEE